jgi:hypothetical protein
VNPPESAPPPDPLAGKTADESWAWALSLVPELAKLTPRPDTADFSKLNMHKGRLTLYAPKLTLGMAKKQPPPCLPLPVVLEGGSLVTRVSLDGRKASPDLADDYTIVRLGVDFNDHDVRTAGDDMGYQSPGSDPLLSEVGRGVIRYDGAPVSHVVLCGTHEETRACFDATSALAFAFGGFTVARPALSEHHTFQLDDAHRHRDRRGPWKPRRECRAPVRPPHWHGLEATNHRRRA